MNGDPQRATAVLREIFGLEFDSLELIACGSSSEVYQTGSGELFRFGRNEAASEMYRWETWLLSQLQSQLSFSVPNPEWHSGSSDAYPYSIMGYRRIPGEPLSRSALGKIDCRQFASDVARFMSDLHSAQVLAPSECSIPKYHADREILEQTRDAVLPRLKKSLPTDEYGVASRWFEFLIQDDLIAAYDPALIHGDLFYGNLLVDPTTSRLTGVVDFGDSCFGDPAQDLAVQHHLGDEFAELVTAEYEQISGLGSSAFRYRIRQLWILREFSGMKYFMDVGDEFEVNCCIEKLRRGPLFDEGGRSA